MSARVLLVLALVACSTNEIRDPDDFTPASRIPHEPLFGTPLHEGSQLRRTTVSVTFKHGPGYVYVYEGAGWDRDLRYTDETATLFRIDPITGAGQPVPGPSLPPSSTHQFGTTTGDAVLLAVGRPTEQRIDLAYFDGTTWTTFMGPPSVELTSITGMLARSASEIVIAGRSGAAWYRTGTSWRMLPLPAQATSNSGIAIVNGPWDDSGLQLVFAHHGQRVCSALYTNAELPAGASAPTATCIDVVLDRIAGSAINGTTSDFQVLVQTETPGHVRLVRFASSGNTVGRSFPGSSLIASPGASRPLVAALHAGAADNPAYLAALHVGEAGELGDRLFGGGVARSPCGCDRATDPSCACFARSAVYVGLATERTGGRMGALVIDDVDARRTLSIRMFDLPFDGEAFPAPECDLICPDTHVCEVNPIDGDSRCVIPGENVLAVEGRVFVAPADMAIGSATWTLSSTNPSCTVTPVPNVPYEVELDPFCTYVLDASAPGHVSLHIDGIVTASENEPVTIGQFTLARGGLADPTSLDAGGFDDTPRLAVSPAGGAMIISVADAWRWIETAQISPGFTTTLLAAAPAELAGPFLSVAPRFVGATRALVHTETMGLHLVDDGAIVATLAGAYDLSRAVLARTSAAAIVPSGAGVISSTPGTASAVTIVRFDGASLVAQSSATVDGYGHVIRADGSEGAFIDTLGRLQLMDAVTGARTVVTSLWSGTTAVRVALGGAGDYVVVAPNAPSPNPVAPCTSVQLCSVFAREDVSGDPGDPIVRQMVSLSARALWAEIGESVGHVVWIERDMSNVARLYRRDTFTRTTTEIALGSTAASDIAHAVVGDKLLVMVPTGIHVIDIATGVSRFETGTFASGSGTALEPLVRVTDAGIIYMREACVGGLDPCGMRVYNATTDMMTALTQAQVSRFGATNNRSLDGGMLVTAYDGAGAVIRTYGVTDGTPAGAVGTFRSSLVRGAPCLLYWREEPAFGGTTGQRRWYCSD